jgi:hypothetical protein
MKLNEAVRRIRREFQILACACEYDEQADIRRRVERLEQLMVERRPTPGLRSNKATRF